MTAFPSDRTSRAPRGLVCSVDQLASGAGVATLRAGGNAADAAVATSAVLAVTTQHMCGMGGDLFALVHEPGRDRPDVLVSVGRAGSGADPAVLRAEGLDALPLRGDVRSATVPGCVDGWTALHERYGRLPLDVVLAPAREYAAGGFPASPLLAAAVQGVVGVAGADDYLVDGRAPRPGTRIRRPRVAAILEDLAAGGRAAFYGGAFGQGLLELGRGWFAPEDLARPLAEWAAPRGLADWDPDVRTLPPPPPGYRSGAGAWIAAGLPLPGDPDDAAWPHLLSEAARAAGRDRLDVLFDGADGPALVDPARLAPRRDAIDADRQSARTTPTRPGGTIYLCAVDEDRMGVSLMQSNAADWGAHLVVPGSGIFLHNRGIGFSLREGHPAELGPGRRPPHTLSPALVTRGGRLSHLLGSMGGDIQPQVVLQLLARLLHAGQTPADAVGAARWTIGDGGFDSWKGEGPQTTQVEEGAPPAWSDGLARRGHHVVPVPAGSGFGHAHVLEVGEDGLAGAVDPRALTGAAIGY
ncbi:MAG: gamma-glutamyltransferase family protein [Acidimicrobiia bacterium]